MSASAPPLKILSLGLLGSTVLYVAVVFFLANANAWQWAWPIPIPTLWVAFAVLAFLLSGVALLLGKLPLIPRLAMAEMVAILGLVLSFLGQSPLWVLPFAALSFVVQIFLSPFLGRSATDPT